MKILFVTNAYGASGAEEHILDLSDWLSTNGAEPVFLVREEGVFKEKVRQRGFPFRTASRNGARTLLSLPQTVVALLREKPDVVSINREHDLIVGYLSAALSRPLLRRAPKLAAVFHTPTGRRIPLLRRFDGIVCTSRFTAEAFCRSNPGMRERARVIPYGIRLWPVDAETKLDKHRARRFFRDKGFPIIGMVGELWKNQEELVDAARAIVREIPETTIAFVGGGWQRQSDALHEKVRAAGLENNVVLTGRVDRSRIPDIFFDFDLSVSTHRNEGFGIVHIESLCSLTPVVAYNVGGYVEMLGQGGGVLVDGGRDEFAKAVVGLLRDHEERRRLALQGRKVVEERHSLERMGWDHLDVYRSLVAG